MIKRLLLALLAFVSCLGLNAQTNPPDAFVYQGLAKNPGTGGIASKTKVRLKVQVLQGGPTGPMVFEEHHNTTTNADGIFSVLVGRGIKLSVTTYSSLYDIPWSQDSFYFSLSMSIAMRFPPNSYSPYLPIGTQQFFSVPYAMFAKEAQSVLDTLNIASGGNYRFLQLGSQKPVVFYVGDGDTSALNELQELVRLGGRMGLKNGDGSITYTVNLPDSSSINELQMISQKGNTITLSQGGGSVTIDIDDADADPNNEIQTLSKSGTTITLNKSGGSITDSDNQTLSFSGSSLSISSGNSVTLPDSSSSNELQYLEQSNGLGTISLSQGGGLVTLPDSSASNELQTISKSGSIISLSNSGGSVTDSDNQYLTLNGATLSISSGNTIILPDSSANNELQKLTISGNTISLSNSGGSVIVPDSDEQTLSISGNTISISNGNSVNINTNDSDADPSNEIQTISKTGTTISLSKNGGSITDSDGQTLKLNGNTLSISGGNSVNLNSSNSTKNGNQDDMWYGTNFTQNGYLLLLDKDTAYIIDENIDKLIKQYPNGVSDTLFNLSRNGGGESVWMNKPFIFKNLGSGNVAIYHVDTGYMFTDTAEYSDYCVVDRFGNLISPQQGSYSYRFGDISYYNLKSKTKISITNPDYDFIGLNRIQIVDDSLLLIGNRFWKYNQDTIVPTSNKIPNAYFGYDQFGYRSSHWRLDPVVLNSNLIIFQEFSGTPWGGGGLGDLKLYLYKINENEKILVDCKVHTGNAYYFMGTTDGKAFILHENSGTTNYDKEFLWLDLNTLTLQTTRFRNFIWDKYRTNCSINYTDHCNYRRPELKIGVIRDKRNYITSSYLPNVSNKRPTTGKVYLNP